VQSLSRHGDSTANTRRQSLKRCHQDCCKRARASGSGQKPRDPHANSVLIRPPRHQCSGWLPMMSSTAINRHPRPFSRPNPEKAPWQLHLIIHPSVANAPWQLQQPNAVHPPECRTEVSSLEARRMLAKLGEHRPVPPRPAKNPGAAWGSTCHDGPCKERPNMVLEVAVLY
jgi:hypothetical protein